jgi:hypothetical protein
VYNIGTKTAGHRLACIPVESFVQFLIADGSIPTAARCGNIFNAAERGVVRSAETLTAFSLLLLLTVLSLVSL